MTGFAIFAVLGLAAAALGYWLANIGDAHD
jgi:hypothetical protein